MRKISTGLLQPGMKVGRPIYDAAGTLLLNKGIILKQEYIARLQRLLVPSIYIEDKLIPDIVIEDVILDETRYEALDLARSILSVTCNGQTKKKAYGSSFIAGEKINAVLDNIILQLLGNPNLIVNLADIRTADNYTFAHSVNVAVLALISAISLGFSRGDLSRLGLGAFLHDLGKTKIPLSILNKPGPLFPEEFDIIKRHPRDGYDLVRAQDQIGSASTAIIFQHHERIDGSGYPQNLRGGEIHTLAKICSIVDVYDALTADRPYRPALPPHRALEIMEGKGDEFDLVFLQNLFMHIAAYPIGTVVGLSSGMIGIVTKNTVGFSLRPTVRIFRTKDLQKVNPYEINLIEKLNIVVDKVFGEEEAAKLSLL